MIAEPGRVTRVEAKAGATVASDMLKPIHKVGQIMDELADVERFVVFGGDIGQKRSNVTVLPWNRLHEVEW